jgi:DNA-binding GntR family transcriptional regulator
MNTVTRPNLRNQDVPLVEQAYQALKQSLIRCEFDPGQRLRLEELQKRYGLSSSPLREALNRLVQQGFVKAPENRGFRVAPITVEAIKDLTRVRLLVETEALRDAMTHGDDNWETGIVAAFHGLNMVEKRMPPGPAVLNDGWTERHRTFHLSTYAGCSSPLLLELAMSLFDQSERFRRYSALHRKTTRPKGHEHEEIFEAVIARDQARATALLQQHLKSTEHNVTESLTEMQQSSTTAH